MITHLSTPQKATIWCEQQRALGKTIGFIPTMGALHDGHLALVKKSVSENNVSCASIFVNPLQFNNVNDLDNYPKTFNSDLEKLNKAQCDMAFCGTLNQFFPEVEDVNNLKLLDPGPAGKGLEGLHRPGHLEGVVTIVDRLFRTIGNSRAYFGEKDFQQTLVVKYLATQLKNNGIEIEVNVCPTVRNSNGLALSSRNQRLTSSQREIALLLYRALIAAKAAWQSGERDIQVIESTMTDLLLSNIQIKVDYAEIRDEVNWAAHTATLLIEKPRALIAARLGKVRLIDNMAITG